MYLICFDLDGTLLNKSSLISPFTRETLALLSKNGISYTVATGRTMLSAQDKYYSRSDAALLPLAALPADAAITNISMIGDADAINEIWSTLNSYESLIAYSGPAIEGPEYRWMDVHHCKANKGSAATSLKDTLGASKLMCFGDSDNDLSMFELADECYAPINAKSHIKDKATSVIGHHDEDGIARFLRERFSL